MVTAIKGNATSTFGGITDAPAFAARNSSDQSISTAVLTKVAFDTEYFDTNSCFDTTNYRFTPDVAGYYQINTTLRHTGTMSLQIVALRKNGTDNYYLNQTRDTVNNHPQGSILIYMNGTTDYIEIYGRSDGSSLAFGFASDGNCCLVSGYLARAV
jgi:hypothetical protein